jgi:uncharacterized protein YcfJ
MIRHRKARLGATAIALSLILCPALAAAQAKVYPYPSKGQSKAQQEKDRDACNSWAVRQSGFDPAYAQAPPEQKGGVLKGGAVGGGIGAIGGAIGGNAGAGAAIGAVTGGLVGGVRQKRKNDAATQQQQSKLAEYNTALTTCYKGRGYTVN